MSVADVYASAEELMDLKLNPSKEGQLIHPYNQVRSIPNSNRREIRVLNFATPNFGQRNQLLIPPMDLRITEMYVEFELSAETSQSNPTWEPTTTWLTLQGVDLLYKNFSVLNMSEPECTMATILDERENVFDAKYDIYAFDRRTDNAGTATKLYLPLNHLCNQVLSKIGAISAYQAGDWAVAVDLRPLLQCISAASEITAPTTGISRMRLICMGAKVPVGEILMQKDALYKNGIVWNFLRSHRFRDTINVVNVSNTITITRTYTSVKGNISHVRQCHRDKANYDGAGQADRNNIDWDARDFYGVNSTLSVGKTSRPTEVFGQPIYPPLINTFFMKSNMGQSQYIAIGDASLGATSASAVDTGIRDISFAESVCDILHGTSTGSYPVDSDFRTSLVIAPDLVNTVAQYLDTIIYTHVRGVLTAKTININISH